jgi:hypothetical protein
MIREVDTLRVKMVRYIQKGLLKIAYTPEVKSMKLLLYSYKYFNMFS